MIFFLHLKSEERLTCSSIFDQPRLPQGVEGEKDRERGGCVLGSKLFSVEDIHGIVIGFPCLAPPSLGRFLYIG
jgi:hypothetical protein